MIVDTSALAAILLKEPEAGAFYDAIMSVTAPRLSAASFVELVEVYAKKIAIDDLLDVLHADLAVLGLVIEPVTAEQATIAAVARLRFGKGRHPARLNYGDSFSYALAKSLNAPLLYKGDDFAHTDIRSAL
ncbi:VapC toxin family PIN domain ribonuclease [Caulobacter sp. D4A]|uniref:type II toxin-antitoxin system VapC family toxin n=1 Tax=unclassified Caulobacter TaxID=2648921 RepID=UPI000D72B183|nr:MULTISPECIES: type II toxin-antitoxin system VapC family toxin [unclassified Caulobacter]PXA79875.1 VapC toxin family PIN domain ribonuclease [Caulobacter sp. D4A]PXA94857.1 VapC toxin family PIN domain ribonuclease [Caulobacter sp. D5]